MAKQHDWVYMDDEELEKKISETKFRYGDYIIMNGGIYGFFDGKKIVQVAKIKKDVLKRILPKKFKIFEMVNGKFIPKNFWSGIRAPLYYEDFVWFDHYSYREELTKNIKIENEVSTFCKKEGKKIRLVVDTFNCPEFYTPTPKQLKTIAKALKSALEKKKMMRITATNDWKREVERTPRLYGMKCADTHLKTPDDTIYVDCYDLLVRYGKTPRSIDDIEKALEKEMQETYEKSSVRLEILNVLDFVRDEAKEMAKDIGYLETTREKKDKTCFDEESYCEFLERNFFVFYRKKIQKMLKDCNFILFNPRYEFRLKIEKIPDAKFIIEDQKIIQTAKITKKYKKALEMLKHFEAGRSGILVKADGTMTQYCRVFNDIMKQAHCACLSIIPYKITVAIEGNMKIVVFEYDTESG